ncbi:hypothetical protein Tco_0863337 [Tanacetum coccineum]
MAKEVGVETVEEASIVEGEEEALVLTPELAKEKRMMVFVVVEWKITSNHVKMEKMVRAGGGEVNGGGVVLGVSKHFSLDFIVVLLEVSGGVVIGEVGGARCVSDGWMSNRRAWVDREEKKFLD